MCITTFPLAATRATFCDGHHSRRCRQTGLPRLGLPDVGLANSEPKPLKSNVWITGAGVRTKIKPVRRLKGLGWQTALRGHIERQRLFQPVANLFCGPNFAVGVLARNFRDPCDLRHRARAPLWATSPADSPLWPLAHIQGRPCGPTASRQKMRPTTTPFSSTS
jgi:hypothetical protein